MTRIVAISGGVGGAKLAHGLQMSGASVTVVVNTGDDFTHLGLHVSPDIDTVVYTLAGLAHPQQGWGLAGETWNFMEQIARLGGPDWFRLGDRDLAMHAIRTSKLRAGLSLTDVTRELAAALGVTTTILPAANEPIATMVRGPDGEVAFQDYFVRRQCRMTVSALRFEGIEKARPTKEVLGAFNDERLEAVIFCPSNPYISIAPIIDVPGMRDAMRQSLRPIVAVSPIIGGNAVKGPTAQMMRDLGHTVSALGIAKHYLGLIHGLVIDQRDEALAPDIEKLGLAVHVCNTLMMDDRDRQALANACVAFCRRLKGAP